MKKYISKNENISRTLENHSRAFKQKTGFLQLRGIMQAVLNPNAGCAISELRNDNKRDRYFTLATRNWYNPEMTKANLMAGIAARNVQYITNPRTVQITNRANLLATLGLNLMTDVIPLPAGGFAPAPLAPQLPVGEHTFVFQGNVLWVAPNSQASKFVHPNILGGWTPVDSAGTLKMNATHIKITNDSGHYQPGPAEIDYAHTRLLALLARPGGDKATGVRKFHRVHWYRNLPKYKKAAL